MTESDKFGREIVSHIDAIDDRMIRIRTTDPCDLRQSNTIITVQRRL